MATNGNGTAAANGSNGAASGEAASGEAASGKELHVYTPGIGERDFDPEYAAARPYKSNGKPLGEDRVHKGRAFDDPLGVRPHDLHGGHSTHLYRPTDAFIVEIDGEQHVITPGEDLCEIKTWHRQVMYRLLGGERPGDIAEAMGVNSNTVNILTRSPLFRAELRELEKKIEAKVLDVRERFIAAGPAMFNVLREAAETSPRPADRISAATKILEYIPDLKPADKKEVSVNHLHLSVVQEAWERRKAAMAQRAEPVIFDVEAPALLPAPAPAEDNGFVPDSAALAAEPPSESE